jgi:hypothetical protein
VNLGEALRTRDGSGGPQETIGYSIKRRLLGPLRSTSSSGWSGCPGRWRSAWRRPGPADGNVLVCMPNRVRRTASAAAPGPLTWTCAAPVRPKRYSSSSPGGPAMRAVGSPRAGPDGPARARPLKLKTRTTQPPGEKPGRAADVAPQGLVHAPPERPGTTAVGPAQVLVVDEELVQARQPAHPAEAEEAGRRP